MSNIKEKYCPNWVRIIFKPPEDASGTALLRRLPCGNWECPYCGPINRKRWLLRLLKGFDGKRFMFLTITCRPNSTPQSSLNDLKRTHERFVKRLKRVLRDEDTLTYALVYEVHKSGVYHSHLIVSPVIEKLLRIENKNKTVTFTASDDGELQFVNWLKDTTANLGLGYMAHVEYRKNSRSPKHAAMYALKYITMVEKNASKFPRHWRRVCVSRDVPPLTPARDDDVPSQWKIGYSVSFETAQAVTDLDERKTIHLWRDGIPTYPQR